MNTFSTRANSPFDRGEPIWPRSDYSRIPYWLFTDEVIYKVEQERVFRGPIWNYVGMEAEIAHAFDFKTTFVGDTPVIISRDKDGGLMALVNRCAHRGALVQRQACGNAESHRCIYHQWTYSVDGKLTGIPFRRGIRGKGGLDASFIDAEHNLQRLRIASYRGLMFVTFSEATEPLPDYLGQVQCAQLDRLMFKPIRILGFQKQVIRGNWKFYQENLRDTYHASLLHSFFSTFGLDRVTNAGGTILDEAKRHSFVYNKLATITGETDRASTGTNNIYANVGVNAAKVKLQDTAMLQYRNEYGDDMGLYISCLFPNGHFQQMNNCLNTRQMIPRGPDSFEVVWTHFGYADDDEEMVELRKLQANFIGPAGFVSMEDAEVIENLQSTIRNENAASSVVEMGGRGAICRDLDNKVNEVPIRGFWSYYARLMDIEAENGER